MNKQDLQQFTPVQRKAIAGLEQAFRACARAHLLFFGVDDDIYVLDEYAFDEALARHGDSQSAALYDEQPPALSTGGTYRDSGGW